ncbi:MAG: hypothetical protein JWN93_2786 [Hyphomicrobiales bacterium]|nr:hypothetical protein [Hyphomicrobiales bacterium]
MPIQDGATLKQAIRAGELAVHYQPQVSADGLRLLGVEALARWNHPREGLLSPSHFLGPDAHPAAVFDVGDFVLRRGCEDAARWPGLTLSVNVSPHQFRDPAFPEAVGDIARQAGMPLERLELEILENAWFADVAGARAALTRLRALGVRIAIDDFGQGYSSMGLLHDLPLDKLKLDRAFATGGPGGAPSEAVPQIVALARALGLTVTAEGVETHAQREFMRAAGCDALQGYLFSRPVPAHAIDELLRGA